MKFSRISEILLSFVSLTLISCSQGFRSGEDINVIEDHYEVSSVEIQSSGFKDLRASKSSSQIVFQLVNTSTGQFIRNLENGAVIDLASISDKAISA